jgi:SNF2 family DNA or RNA helicase
MEWMGQYKKNSVLICDESQFIKNASSKRTSAVMGHSTTGRGGLFDSAGIYWPLTGTPIEAYPNDLWSQLRAAFGDELRAHNAETYENFVRKFCIVRMKQFNKMMRPKVVVSGAKNEVELNHMLYREVGAIRRTMDEIEHDMPPLTYRTIAVKCEHDRTLSAFDEQDPEAEGMAEMLHLLGVYKALPAAEYIAGLGKQVLVGYWHTDVGDALVAELQKVGSTARVAGFTSMAAREAARIGFNDGNVQFIVGQISAMNTAWNLQKSGSHVVIVEDNFSPSKIEQFVKRVWRIGQERHVQVDMIQSQYKLDKTVTRVRQSKEAINQRVIG